MSDQFTAPLLRHFGLPARLPLYRSEQHETYEEEIVGAIENDQLVALVGERGAGKSTLFKMARQRLVAKSASRFRFVRVLSRDVEKLRIGHVMSAAISQLTNGEESASRDSERRTAQFLKIVGPIAAKEGHHVCVFIEEAHGLPLQLLLDIKALREIEFGVTEPPLFSVVLIGHTGLRTLVETREEIHWRTLTLDLRADEGWMERDDRYRYLEARFGVALDQDARAHIATHNAVPLALDHAVAEAMRTARAAGFPLVDHRTLPAGLDDIKGWYDLSDADIASLADVSKATVSEVRHGKASPEMTDKVQEALNRFRSTHAAEPALAKAA